MKLYNIKELKFVVAYIDVPNEMIQHIFSFVEGDYEKKNYDILRIRAKNKRVHEIFKKINNEIENGINDEIYGFDDDLPFDDRIPHCVHFYNDDKTVHGVSDREFKKEVHICMTLCDSIKQIKYRGKVDSGIGYYFTLNKKNANILNKFQVTKMEKSEFPYSVRSSMIKYISYRSLDYEYTL